MTVGAREFLCDRVLTNLGVVHGFGQRCSQVPDKTQFLDQVHGIAVFDATSVDAATRPRADAVFSTVPGLSVGIVTADCVPILVAAEDGSAVAAIHAGWKGLTKGVIEAGLRAVSRASKGVDLVAAVGPGARGCCYEVDEPVRTSLMKNYSEGLEEFLQPGRSDHFQFDLALLATRILTRNGVDRRRIGTQHSVCTICDPDRFESVRREGAKAGRLRHFITRPV